MKFRLLYVLGFAFVLLGLIGYSVVVEEFISNEPRNPILGPLVSGMLTAAGVLIFIAAKTKYRLTFSIVTGACLIFFGLTTLAMGLEEMIAGQFFELTIHFIVAAISLFFGVWFMRRGHQGHLKTITAQSSFH